MRRWEERHHAVRSFRRLCRWAGRESQRGSILDWTPVRHVQRRAEHARRAVPDQEPRHCDGLRAAAPLAPVLQPRMDVNEPMSTKESVMSQKANEKPNPRAAVTSKQKVQEPPITGL